MGFDGHVVEVVDARAPTASKCRSDTTTRGYASKYGSNLCYGDSLTFDRLTFGYRHTGLSFDSHAVGIVEVPALHPQRPSVEAARPLVKLRRNMAQIHATVTFLHSVSSYVEIDTVG